MKRIIIIFMAFLLMVGAAVGCQPSNPPAEETKPSAEVADTTSARSPLILLLNRRHQRVKPIRHR